MRSSNPSAPSANRGRAVKRVRREGRGNLPFFLSCIPRPHRRALGLSHSPQEVCRPPPNIQTSGRMRWWGNCPRSPACASNNSPYEEGRLPGRVAMGIIAHAMQERHGLKPEAPTSPPSRGRERDKEVWIRPCRGGVSPPSCFVCSVFRSCLPSLSSVPWTVSLSVPRVSTRGSFVETTPRNATQTSHTMASAPPTSPLPRRVPADAPEGARRRY